jgi:hypothetical protein
MQYPCLGFGKKLGNIYFEKISPGVTAPLHFSKDCCKELNCFVIAFGCSPESYSMLKEPRRNPFLLSYINK